MLAAPSSGSGDAMLSQAIKAAVDRDLVLPGQYVVCVSSVNNAIQLKIIGVDDFGRGIHPEQGAAHEGELNLCIALLPSRGVHQDGRVIVAVSIVRLHNP